MSVDIRLLETGDNRLLETGGNLLLQSSDIDLNGYLLLQNGDFRLLETGARRALEGLAIASPFFLGFYASGKLGKPGEPDPLGIKGIWKTIHTKKGRVKKLFPFYTPFNPQTELQEANRQKFADAVAAWMSLTSEEKLIYTKRAKKRQMFGWGLFIREYYKNN